MHVAGILSVGEKIRIGDAVSKDIKVTSGEKSSGTTLLHLVCQQNIGDFRPSVYSSALMT
jgi:hypothetical protein